MSEAAILQAIRLDLGREPSVRLFRNNTGTLLDRRGKPVSFGLHRGSGDLIGWRSVTVTPDMLGRTVAILASVEVKAPRGRPTPDQIHWAAAVQAAGGIAGIARSPEDARRLLGLAP
jgi:hypothetical protein